MKEAKGFGGFPVSGEWLRTNKPHLTGAHHAKVYGLPPLGAPPMSMPHLDTRVINGQDWLLFGPFAGWSPKFLKGQGHRPAAVGQAEQPGLDDRGG
jgi:malate dehydrogenase (quinone)